jgi:hypothetical protein
MGVLPEIEIKNIPANLLGSSVTVRYALKGVLTEIELKNMPFGLLCNCQVDTCIIGVPLYCVEEYGSHPPGFFF